MFEWDAYLDFGPYQSNAGAWAKDKKDFIKYLNKHYPMAKILWIQNTTLNSPKETLK